MFLKSMLTLILGVRRERASKGGSKGGMEGESKHVSKPVSKAGREEMQEGGGEQAFEQA